MIGLLRSHLGIFLLRKFGVVGVLHWSARGCNLAAHSSVHSSFILRGGLTRFQLPEGFLGLRIVTVQEFFWYTGMRPGCHTDGKHHNPCSQSFASTYLHGTYSWQPYTLPACQPFLSSSSFTWINPFKASFLLSRKHAPFHCERCWHPPLTLVAPDPAIRVSHVFGVYSEPIEIAWQYHLSFYLSHYPIRDESIHRD